MVSRILILAVLFCCTNTWAADNSASTSKTYTKKSLDELIVISRLPKMNDAFLKLAKAALNQIRGNGFADIVNDEDASVQRTINLFECILKIGGKAPKFFVGDNTVSEFLASYVGALKKKLDVWKDSDIISRHLLVGLRGLTDAGTIIDIHGDHTSESRNKYLNLLLHSGSNSRGFLPSCFLPRLKEAPFFISETLPYLKLMSQVIGLTMQKTMEINSDESLSKRKRADLIKDLEPSLQKRRRIIQSLMGPLSLAIKRQVDSLRETAPENHEALVKLEELLGECRKLLVLTGAEPGFEPALALSLARSVVLINARNPRTTPAAPNIGVVMALYESASENMSAVEHIEFLKLIAGLLKNVKVETLVRSPQEMVDIIYEQILIESEEGREIPTDLVFDAVEAAVLLEKSHGIGPNAEQGKALSSLFLAHLSNFKADSVQKLLKETEGSDRPWQLKLARALHSKLNLKKKKAPEKSERGNAASPDTPPPPHPEQVEFEEKEEDQYTSALKALFGTHRKNSNLKTAMESFRRIAQSGNVPDLEIWNSFLLNPRFNVDFLSKLLKEFQEISEDPAYSEKVRNHFQKLIQEIRQLRVQSTPETKESEPPLVHQLTDEKYASSGADTDAELTSLGDSFSSVSSKTSTSSAAMSEASECKTPLPGKIFGPNIAPVSVADPMVDFGNKSVDDFGDKPIDELYYEYLRVMKIKNLFSRRGRLQKLANRGSSTAKFALAYMIEVGDGGKLDSMEAANLYCELALEERPFPGVLNNLGTLLERKHVKLSQLRDGKALQAWAKAKGDFDNSKPYLFLYNAAASLGSVDAQVNLQYVKEHPILPEKTGKSAVMLQRKKGKLQKEK